MQSNHSEIHRIDGVGVNLERFYPVGSEEEKAALRGSYGFSPDDFILLYTAEFIPRKNHRLVFSILKELKLHIPELKMVFCGSGRLLEDYKLLASAGGMGGYVLFTGYTNNVDDYCRLSDVLVMPSLQEGSPLAMMEGMACGLPIVASNIRGHRDVVVNYENGLLCDLGSPKSFLGAIILLYKNESLRNEMRLRNIERAKLFSVSTAIMSMEKIYLTLIPPPITQYLSTRIHKLSVSSGYTGRVRFAGSFPMRTPASVREAA